MLPATAGNGWPPRPIVSTSKRSMLYWIASGRVTVKKSRPDQLADVITTEFLYFFKFYRLGIPASSSIFFSSSVKHHYVKMILARSLFKFR